MSILCSKYQHYALSIILMICLDYHLLKTLFNLINNNKQYILNSRLNYNIDCKDYAYIPKYLKNYDKSLLKLINKDVNIIKYIPQKFRNLIFLNNITKL